jgi:hypothetical protein
MFRMAGVGNCNAKKPVDGRTGEVKWPCLLVSMKAAPVWRVELATVYLSRNYVYPSVGWIYCPLSIAAKETCMSGIRLGRLDGGVS